MNTSALSLRTVKTIALILIVIAAVLCLMDLNPILRPVPNRDSGVFLYAGQQMLSGGTPYLTAWDHKGPFLYFLNFLGVLITPHSVAGIFLVQLILFAIAALLWADRLQNSAMPGAVILGFAFLLHALICTLEGGNLTEVYTSFFFMFSVALLLGENSDTNISRIFVLGLLAGAVLLMRPTNAALWFVYGCWLMIQWIRTKSCKSLFAYGAGLVLTLLLALLILSTKGAFSAFKSQFIDFNFFYVEAETQSGIRSQLAQLLKQLRYLWILLNISWGKGFMRLVLGALAVSAFRLFNRSVQPKKPAFSRLRGILFVSLLLEIFLVILPERMYRHYLIIFAAYAAFFVTDTADWIMISLHKKIRSQKSQQFQLYLLLPGIMVLLWALIPSFRSINATISGLQTGTLQIPHNPTAEEQIILSNSAPTDTVQIWQGETRFNFLTGRKSPTAYSYVFPLWSCGYATPAIWDEFLNDFSLHLPKMFIVAAEHKDQYGIVPEGCEAVADRMNAFYGLIQDNFRLSGLQSKVFDSVYILQ